MVEEGNHEGICDAIENAVNKMEFNFERSTREVGVCTDGAAVNVAGFRKMRDKVV